MYNRFENDAARIEKYRIVVENEKSSMTEVMGVAALAADEAHILSRTTTDDKEQLAVAAKYFSVSLSGYNRLYRETGIKYARNCYNSISQKLIALLHELGKYDELKAVEQMTYEFSNLPELEYRNPDRDVMRRKK